MRRYCPTDLGNFVPTVMFFPGRNVSLPRNISFRYGGLVEKSFSPQSSADEGWALADAPVAGGSG